MLSRMKWSIHLSAREVKLTGLWLVQLCSEPFLWILHYCGLIIGRHNSSYQDFFWKGGQGPSVERRQHLYGLVEYTIVPDWLVDRQVFQKSIDAFTFSSGIRRSRIEIGRRWYWSSSRKTEAKMDTDCNAPLDRGPYACIALDQSAILFLM